MLKLQPLEPEWLDIIPGVRVRFAPIGIKAVRAAREAVREALGLEEDDLVGAGDALSRALIARGILEWEGVGDRDGNVLPVTPEAVALFLADPRAFEAADHAYVRPWAARDMEGNAFAGSPNGTSAKATPAPDIAISPARPPRAKGAKRIRKPAPKAAPIGKMNRLPKKAKLSGR